VRLLREYGWRTRADSELPGVNARLDELHAALLRVMLPRLDTANARRSAIAERYTAELTGLGGLRPPSPISGTRPVWHQYVVNHPRRDDLRERLARAGVGTAVHYSPAPPLTTAFRAGLGRASFAVAEAHAATALSLPMHPALTDGDVERVIAAVRDAR
jgi:dTDP-4-amino-4,6-dideoxygalactose transaminase